MITDLFRDWAFHSSFSADLKACRITAYEPYVGTEF